MSSGHIEVRSDTELPHVHVVRLQPGDVLVYHVDARVSDEMFEHIVSHSKEQFPDHQAIVLDGGMKLSVVRRDGE